MRLNRQPMSSIALIMTAKDYAGPVSSGFRRIKPDSYDDVRFDVLHQLHHYESLFENAPEVEGEYYPPSNIRMAAFIALVTVYVDVQAYGFTIDNNPALTRTAIVSLEESRLIDYSTVPIELNLNALKRLGFDIKHNPKNLLHLTEEGLDATVSIWRHLFPRGIAYAESLFFDRARYPAL
jgi:hypothetical protein